jgi:anti-repressor protein
MMQRALAAFIVVSLSLASVARAAPSADDDATKKARQYFIECERRAKSNVVDLHSALGDPNQLRTMLLAYTEKVMVLENKVSELKPKATFYDKVCEAVNGQTVQEVAKILGTGPNRLFVWLRERSLLMRNNLPYQTHLDNGHFRVIERHYDDQHGESRTYTRTLITGQGLAFIEKRFAEGVVA